MNFQTISIDKILNRVIKTQKLKALSFSICGNNNSYKTLNESINFIYFENKIKVIIHSFGIEEKFILALNVTNKSIHNNKALVSLQTFWQANEYKIEISKYLKYIDQNIFNNEFPHFFGFHGLLNDYEESSISTQFYYGLIIKYWHFNRRYSDFGYENRGYVILGDARYYDIWKNSSLAFNYNPSGTRNIGFKSYSKRSGYNISNQELVFCNPRRYNKNEQIKFITPFEHFYAKKKYLCINFDDLEKKHPSANDFNEHPSYSSSNIFPCSELVKNSFILTQNYNGVDF